MRKLHILNMIKSFLGKEPGVNITSFYMHFVINNAGSSIQMENRTRFIIVSF